MWCEMGSCISWHADPAALGEADTRARAIAAGWRIDALGRLACPQCQQNDTRYRAARPVVPRDRYTAIARTTRSQPRRAAAMTPAALPAATPRPAGRSWNGTTIPRPMRPCPLADTPETPPVPPIPAVRSSMRSEPGELAAAARRHLVKPVSPART